MGDENENEEEHHSRPQHRNHDRWRKLEIPVFSGEAAFGWVQKLERYFLIRDVTNEEKMQATMVAFDGRALSWYQWRERCNLSPTWESFKIVVVRRFQPSMIPNPYELLLSLKQEKSVDEYVEEFEKYVGALKVIDQDFVKGIFLNGLKEEIRVEVRLYELKTLTEVIQKAILIEQKNSVVTKRPYMGNTKFSGSYRNNNYSRVVTVEPQTATSSKREGSSVGSVNGGSIRSRGEYKKLTSDEMREKREKGLCFRCDEPFNKDHMCKNRQMRMLILAEGDDEVNDLEGEDEIETLNSLQLSMYSMTGLTTSKSWKVGGIIKDQPVVILIDCGASHNFIAKDSVDRLKLKVDDTPAYVVEVGDGHKVQNRGKCTQPQTILQQLEVIQDFYLFGLKGVDLVLGLDWLASLGEVKVDFGRMELTLMR
ncbi:uncharacterized protein [Cicer arietinum]|uniref:uncharacterized protein n=1 Tax=Cicer arietinum TaxID=3827 RepID=UPI003CC50746